MPRIVSTAGCICRSPHGERGLKSFAAAKGAVAAQSLPTRGAWIEIKVLQMYALLNARRSPHGERGLKWRAVSTPLRYTFVAPHTGSVD